MITRFALQMANGVTEFDVPDYSGYHQIILGFTTYPTAGAMKIEVRPRGSSSWFAVPEAEAINMTLPRYAIAYGDVDKYRFTISGLAGGSGLEVLIVSTLEYPGPGLPPGLFQGLRAMTMQNYTEANVKNGVQYEVSSNTASLANGANIDTIFITGNKPVLIKARTVKFNGSSLLTRVYSGATYTGGTPVPYFNMNDRNQVAGDVQIIGGATIDTLGTEFGAPTYDIGSTGLGNVSISTFSTTGIERLLKPNTIYLQRINNDSGAAQRVSGGLTWYAGDTDLPVT